MTTPAAAARKAKPWTPEKWQREATILLASLVLTEPRITPRQSKAITRLLRQSRGLR